MFQDVLDRALRLDGIRPVLIDSVPDMDELHTEIWALRKRRRKYDQMIVVKLLVRETDETTVLRAIVPPKKATRRVESAGNIQDTLGIRSCGEGVVVLLGFLVQPLEERRGRQLHAVADYDELAAPQYCAESILGAQLRRFVHDHQVECDLATGKILGHRKWTHHETGLQSLKGPRRSGDELAEWKMTPLLR